MAGPCEERISLHSLRGARPWLLTSRAGSRITPGMQFTVTRPHLRNLYFQINALLSLDILPEVLDSSGAEARQQRRQFTGVLKDCQRLLTSLGVLCVTAPGEAEAFCSALNRTGL